MPATASNKQTKRVYVIKDISSQITVEDLKEIEKRGGARIFRSSTLPLEILNVADRVFQWRTPDYNIFAEIQHTKHLMSVVAEGLELDPVLVMQIGSQVFLVDGHHRLAAYRSQGWTKAIPVKWFEKTIDEARDEAWDANNKNKLPLTPRDRMEYAWAMVKRGDAKQPGGASKAEISIRSGVSQPQIAIMRRKWNADPITLAALPWHEAQRSTESYLANNEWQDEKTADIAKNIRKNFYLVLQKYPDLFCDALEALNPNLPLIMVRHWADVAEEVTREIDAEREETGLDI